MVAVGISVDDLAGWLGEAVAGEGEISAATAALRYGRLLVETEVGYGFDDGAIPDAARQVILAVAARGYSNPESFTYESVDDWRAGAVPLEQVGMYLTKAEKTILAGLRRGTGGPIGSVATRRAPVSDLSGCFPMGEGGDGGFICF